MALHEVTRSGGRRAMYVLRMLALLAVPAVVVHVVIAVFTALLVVLLSLFSAQTLVAVSLLLLAAALGTLLCLWAVRGIGRLMKSHLRIVAGVSILAALALVMWPYANPVFASAGRNCAPLEFIWGLYLAFRANRRRFGI